MREFLLPRCKKISRCYAPRMSGRCIAVFPILAEVVEVKTVSRSTAHWRIHIIRLNGWLRHIFAQLVTLLDIDRIGQKWEGSNISLKMSSRIVPFRQIRSPVSDRLDSRSKPVRAPRNRRLLLKNEVTLIRIARGQTTCILQRLRNNQADLFLDTAQ